MTGFTTCLFGFGEEKKRAPGKEAPKKGGKLTLQISLCFRPL